MLDPAGYVGSSPDGHAQDAHELNDADRNIAREATELHSISHPASQQAPSSTSRGSATDGLRQLRLFWKRQIRLTVPHAKARDFLALERTYLAYIRTSMAISMIGVLIAQLFRLQHSSQPDKVFGYHAVSVPLACICQAVATGLAIIGAHRYWRQQNAMARGKVRAGGWEMTVTAIAVFLLTLTLFAVLVGINVHKDVHGVAR